MPLADWQFWIVTLAAAAAVYALWRILRPRSSRRAPRVELTIDRSRHDA